MSFDPNLPESGNSATVDGGTPTSTSTAVEETPVLTQTSSIYDEQGRITNPDIAQDIANNENAARDIENKYLGDSERGMTEQEKTNLEIGAMLFEKYPHAIRVDMDEQGQRFYTMVSTGNQYKEEIALDQQNQRTNGIGVAHKALVNDLTGMVGNFAGIDSNIREILRQALTEIWATTRFSKKGLEYRINNQNKCISNSLLPLKEKDIFALKLVLENNEQLMINEAKRKEEFDNKKVGSLDKLKSLLG